MKRILRLLGSLLPPSMRLSACSAVDGNCAASTATDECTSGYHKITAQEAKKRMDQGNVTIVDVRRTEEYQETHIPGAILVPLDTIQDQMPQSLPEKDAPLLVYCRSGNRSKQAARRLLKLGYANIYDFGGILDWPYETERGASNES